MTAPRDPFVVEQEVDALDRRRLARSAAVIVIAAGIGLVAASYLLRAGESGRDVGPNPPPPPQVGTVETSLILGPARGIALRDRQRETLDQYGWADRDAGRARIPIDEAMKLVVERAATDGGAGAMMDFFRLLLGLPTGASSIADGVDGLHMFVIGLTMAMSLYVFAAAAWFTIRYARRHKGQLTSRLSASKTSETLTVVGVLSVFLIWWVIGFRQFIHMATPPKNTEIVYVEAKQWMWKFTYADGRSTNDVLTVPVGTPIKLVMNSRDVIHSFFVPAFRVKADVVPGRTITTWFDATAVGTYPIWCAEYCGVSHSLMRGEVVVLSPDDYETWKSRSGGDKELAEGDCGRGPGSCGGGNLVELGRQVATRRACVACHTLDGQKHIGPTWKGLYGADRQLSDGRHVIADEAYLTRSMMEPNVEIVAGYPQVMPTYQGSLTAAEAGSLVEFIRSLRDGAAPSATPASPNPMLPRLDVTAVDGGTPP